MTGDQALIEFRRAGGKPHGVWITDSDDDYSRVTAREWPHRPNSWTGEYAAHIRLDANDIPGALDLRCCVGLECHLSSDRGRARFDQIFDALVAAGASAVIGLNGDDVRVHHPNPTTTTHG